MSLLVAMALVLHIIERMLPIPMITPGAKLGLANLITLLSLYTLDKKETFMVVMVRTTMSAIFAGGASGWMYGTAGAILSFIVMCFVKEIGKDHVSMIGVSASGAVFHNIGQLTVAVFVLQNFGVMLYLPILTIAGIGTGIFIGLTTSYTKTHMDRLGLFKSRI
jgi:heptaprenyl diphosphate synthase